MNTRESVEDRLEKLEKQVFMLSVAMALVMRIMQKKGLVDENQLEEYTVDDASKKENDSGKEAEYEDVLKKFEVKKENLN